MREPEDTMYWLFVIGIGLCGLMLLVLFSGWLYDAYQNSADQRDCRRHGGTVEHYDPARLSEWRCVSAKQEDR